MPRDENGNLVSGGQTIVHTHLMMTSDEIAQAVAPYIGRSAYAFWGEKRAYVRLDKVDGENITVYYHRSGHSFTGPAELAFGTHCASFDS